MRKSLVYLLVCCLFLVFISHAKSANKGLYGEIYNILEKDYISDVSDDFFIVALHRTLIEMDHRLMFSSVGNRYNVYYAGRFQNSITKPSNKKDFESMDSFYAETIQIAKKVSKEIAIKDFEIEERVLYSIFSNLDENTRYYSYLDLGFDSEKNIKNPRYFASKLLENDILYMKLGPLNFHTKEKILEALEKNSQYKSVILDLRGNHGGLISEAIAVMNLFLDEGIIVSTVNKEKEEKFYIADGTNVVKEKPIVVLVDRETASSAEILASSLREQGLANIIGSTTQGKGSFQKLIILKNQGRIALTNGYFLTPSGQEIDNKGIIPNICTAELDIKLTANLILDNKNNEIRQCIRESRENIEVDVLVAVEMLHQ